MKNNRNNTKNAIRKISVGAVLASLATVLLLLGSFFEILDMTSAAVASVAVLVAYLEFGLSTSLAVYGVSSALSLILFPTSSAAIYYVLILGFFPIFKLSADKHLKNHKILRAVSKFIVFNAGCAIILFLFLKIYGTYAVMKEFEIASLSINVVVMFVFVLLNVFLVMYDILIRYIAIIYVKVLRKRIFPKGQYINKPK